MYRKTYIEIDTDSIKQNINTVTSNYPGYKYYFGVLKGGAYGHGFHIVQAIVEAGVNYIAVSSLEEAIQVRSQNKNIPVLCLQPIHIEDIQDAIKNNITITLSDYGYFQKLLSQGFQGNLNIHIKINSGFNRLGISNMNEVKEIYENLKNYKNIKIEGIYTHLATSGINDEYYDQQIASFKNITSLIDLRDIPIIHLGRSMTILTREKIDFCNGIRFGLLLYGYNPIPKSQNDLKGKLKKLLNSFKSHKNNIPQINLGLKPAMCLFSEIIEVKKILKGEKIGYGATYQMKEDGWIGILPIGYGDGFNKTNVNGYVYIGSTRYQIITVDMNMMTILINEKVNLYDKVELLGKNITAFEFSRRNSTNIYGALCSFQNSIPRLLKENK